MSDEKNSKVCVDDRDQELDGNISSSLSAQLSVLPIKEKVASIGRVGKRKPGSFKPGQGRKRPRPQIDYPEADPNNPEKFEQELAALFDPVSIEALKVMFPDDKSGGWSEFANRAKRMGLDTARQGRGKFNPYLAGKWWLSKRKPSGWTEERLLRTLARNLPARSRDKRFLLADSFSD